MYFSNSSIYIHAEKSHEEHQIAVPLLLIIFVPNLLCVTGESVSVNTQLLGRTPQ